MPERPELSIIAPMYNEVENIASTVEKIGREMQGFGGRWEMILVNDGSTDGSFESARELTADEENIRVIGYEVNRGRGAALRTGFEAARGRIVATVDFDLSYSPDHITRMYRILDERGDVDVVMASAYMPGGSVEGVPRGRLALSRLGNLVLRVAFGGRFHTTTCIVRAYRREVLEALHLESDRKEIHLEILSKALALGFNVVEMPATLKARVKGKAKFTFVRTSISHIFFAIKERPTMLAAAAGVVLAAAAAADLLYAFLRWRTGGFDAGSHLVLLAVMSTVGAAQAGAIWFLAALLKAQRCEMIRAESKAELLQRRIGSLEKDAGE